ncbi:Wzz/FepE/Etk N-terminal domain-containing protein [Hymenobacter fastidiosus]|uniref:Wzz/FepE/Etk N-terminal domain-containing protein n=1 Tax=Hymenobacter fastidiosus TaxID=486264 RepID=A0ABP7RDJ9_9BACT
MSSRSYSLLGLWPVINRWKFLVITAVGLALAGSVVVALLLPNIYKSTAVFYPTNPNTTDPDRIVTEGGKLELGGRTEDLDRVITIGESQTVAELIIRRFRLHKHYKTGQPGDDQADQGALDEFNGNLTVVHNDRDAIELTFKDRDKVLAAKITNTLTQVIDSINQQLTVENRRNIIELYRERKDFLEKEYATTRDSLIQGRRRYGIYGMDRESRYLAKEIIETEADLRRAEGEGDSRRAAGLRRALKGLTQADGGNLLNLENYVAGTDLLSTLYARFNDIQGRLIGARSAYESAQLAISGKISSIYVVQKAFPATKKSKPVRWLIVFSSVLITLVLAVIFITLLELYRGNLSVGKKL